LQQKTASFVIDFMSNGIYIFSNSISITDEEAINLSAFSCGYDQQAMEK